MGRATAYDPVIGRGGNDPGGAVRIELSVAEMMDLVRARGDFPDFVRSVTAQGEEVHVAIDLRKIAQAPAAVRLAARLLPHMHVTVRFLWFTGGTAVVAVDAVAGKLPAHKLLRLLEGRLGWALEGRGLPPYAVRILPDARVAVDIQAILQARLSASFPDLRVDELDFTEETLRVAASLVGGQLGGDAPA